MAAAKIEGNSNKRRDNYQTLSTPKETERPKIQPLSPKGRISKLKKSPGQKFLETFVHEDVKDVKGYIFTEVLIPAIKDTFAAIIHGTTDMLLYGESRRYDRGKDRTSYSKISYGGTSYGSFDRDKRRREREHPQDDNPVTLEDIVFERREEAQECLDRMMDYIDVYGPVSVADFYSMVGEAGQFTDCEYGWSDLRMARVQRIRDGYIIKFPRPYPINM